jgi:hypothetical protein
MIDWLSASAISTGVAGDLVRSKHVRCRHGMADSTLKNRGSAIVLRFARSRMLDENRKTCAPHMTTRIASSPGRDRKAHTNADAEIAKITK